MGGDLNVYQSETNLHNILLDLPDGVSTNATTGTAIKGICGEDSLNEGSLCYLNSDGKWYNSSSADVATLPSTGVATENAVIDEEIYFLLEGIVSSVDPNLFSTRSYFGTTVYILPAAYGTVTNVTSQGSVSNNVQIVGTVLDSSTFLFSPDYTILEQV